MSQKENKRKVVYQIWPRSFLDTNGDGIGDLRGVISKLDYIKELGADLIWLSPIYPSPNHDYGYDISDYYGINPEFGTMEDFDELLAEGKKRGIGIIMDLVVNHTSDEHEWFKQALADKDSKYRDYYFFRPGKNGGAPNNWLSFFGGSAWTREPSGGYYLTTFTPHQCDLNWENPEVREEVYKMMRFWLDKGIAGFRMDVINCIDKAPGLPSKNPEKKGLQFPGDLLLSRPNVHVYLHEMYEKVLSKYDCFTVGETALSTMDDALLYTDPKREELMMLFHFDIAGLGCGELGKFDFRKLYRWSIKDLKHAVTKWQLAMQRGNGWIGNYLSNHDQPRQVSRYGNDKELRRESAKALALLNITQRGTPFFYMGEEIGMTNCELERSEWRDSEAINIYSVLQSMMHLPAPIAEKVVKKMTRDHARTPMQWDGSEYAGFSTVKPWMKVNPNHTQINVKNDMQRGDSIFAFYKQLIAMFKAHPVLSFGEFAPLIEEHPKIIAYTRKDAGETLLTIINLSDKKASADLPVDVSNAKVLLSTHGMRPLNKHIELAPYEGRVYSL